LIFDLEISFLFPWCVVYNQIELFGFWVMYLFLVILTIGLVYEWVKGGLEWE
jgi:NADH:ubiquinone oxidoreductase subunit 3 (subunit A)